MNLTPLIKIAKNIALYEGCLHGHLTVSSQVKLMGQQVIPLLTPARCHDIEGRKDEWSSKGIEYPSGLGVLKSSTQKAEYMTEATFSSKFSLLSSSGPYMTQGGE
jgi:hypothetical protein